MKKLFMTILCTLCALIANAEPVEFISEQLDSVATLWALQERSPAYKNVANHIKEFVNPKQRYATYSIKHQELDAAGKADLEHEVFSWAVDNYFNMTKDIEHRSQGVYFKFNQEVYCGRLGMSKNHVQHFFTSIQIKFYDTEIAVTVRLSSPKMAVGVYASPEVYDLEDHYPYVREGKADAIYALAYRNYEYYLMFPAWDLYQHLKTRHFEIND